MPDARTVGVILGSLTGDFTIKTLAGISQAVTGRGYRMLVIQGTPRSVATSGLARRSVSGWVAMVNADGLDLLAPAPMSAVVIAASAPDPRYPIIQPDNRSGISVAVEHLIAHGHSRIGFVGYLQNTDIYERYQGYQEVLREHGLAFDPDLVLDTEGYAPEYAQVALRPLLGARLPFTALVVATDHLALGVLAALQSAGYRVPEDVAVVGFDDIVDAQFTCPPLTTVRQQPEVLGQITGQVLCDLLDGRLPAQAVLRTPTGLVRRRSCGCQALHDDLLQIQAQQTGAGWQADLARTLLHLIRYPLPTDPSQPLGQVWPAAAALIDGLAAAAAGGTPPATALDRAWDEAVQINDKAETLLALTRAIEQAGARLSPADPQQVENFLNRSRQSMFRARLDVEHQYVTSLENVARMNYQISLLLSSAQISGAAKLDWLRQTPLAIGCIALWSSSLGGTQTDLEIDSSYSRARAAVPPVGQRYAPEAFPPPETLDVAMGEGPGSYLVMLDITTPSRDWGYLVLSNPFTGLVTSNFDMLNMWVTLVGAMLDRSALETALRAERELLRSTYEREHALADTVRELGCPIIPLLPGILLVPLVGAIDSLRAQQIVETVLQGVSTWQANQVLLDITGVPLVDTHVAGLLLQTASAATLLGARVVLVGVRPEIAQSIVALGISLHSLVTYPTLAAAIQVSLRAGR